MNKGMSLIELLLVISITAIIGTASTPFLSNFVLRTHYESASARIRSDLRKAQQYAMDGKEDTVWGVCIQGSTLRLFSGDCTTPTYSEDYTIPSSITISGFTEITFSSFTGQPSSSAIITVSSSIDSEEIILNSHGLVTFNPATLTIEYYEEVT